MPNHGKGGRKPEGNEPKRAAVAVRTTPALKAKLEAAAADSGRSVTQEIEARLEASLDFKWDGLDVKAQELFVAIARDIRRAEELTGKRWHKHLPTWAMVREALASGEIERQCPENDRLLTDTDGDAAELREKRFKLFNSIHHDAVTVGELGFPMAEIERTVANLDTPLFDYEAEAVRLREADLPDAIKSVIKAHYLVRMSEQDDERGNAERAYWESFQWMADAINEGVLRWEQDLRDRGIAAAREYRPSASFQAPRSVWPAATTLAGSLNSLGGAATLGDLWRADPKALAEPASQ